ncbi:hypothetical protein DL95DRAFT_528851 [Leptodontidium sp. 2 PMI_412]|nr:hypothetical protein DL95DRAFT_528851 [Leptodontidium sp. 2 PMI_412]
MDPLSALSVVGTIVQFVDFGSKLLNSGYGLYKSSKGASAANLELECITADLQSVLSKLKNSASAAELSGPVTEEEHKSQLSFKEVCEGAAFVANELLERLETLKVKGKKFKKFQSLHKALQNLWSKEEVAGISNRLEAFKTAMNTRILLSLREKIDAHSLSVSALVEHMDNRSQMIISTIVEEISVKASQHQEEQLAKFMLVPVQLLRRIDSSSYSHSAPSSLEDDKNLVSAFEMLSVLPSKELALRRRAEEVIIQSFRYDKMTHRYEDVLEAYQKTFEWIFDDDARSQVPWDNFATWLKDDQAVYWISGKAGSGKSTLMKHIFDDNRTRVFLERWAQDKPLCQASFFFWNSGSQEQRSQTGCLKALLFQIFNQYPDLISLTLPKRWADLYSTFVHHTSPSTPPWTLRELLATFRALVRQQKIPIGIFIMIDGLDEFDGDHEELVDLFKETTTLKNVKTCLSSRPWVLFRDGFSGCASLRLQDLTYNDISLFVDGRFGSNASFRKLVLHEAESAATLVNDIVLKADGVFLWVRLVVKSLLDGLRNHDDVATLQERLALIPRELNDLYTHLLGLIDPVYLRWSSRAFQILRLSRELEHNPFGPRRNARTTAVGVLPLTLDAFYFAMNEECCFDDSQHLTWSLLKERYRDTEIHLTARCAGLLEVTQTNGSSQVSRRSSVDYFHRSARDYLEKGPIWLNILQHTAQTNFSPSLSMLKAYTNMLWMEPILNNVDYFRNVIHDTRNSRLPDERLISTAFIYAYHSDKLNVFSNTQAAWLDAMDQSLGRRKFEQYWGNELPLCNVPRNAADEIPIFDSILCLAVVYQLTWYVQHKLALQPPRTPTTRARHLLRLSMPFREYEWCADLPHPTPKMTAILLRHGAKPNARYSRLTAWENVLRLLHILPKSQICWDILRVAELLLLSGADPRASLKTGSVTSKSTWEIFGEFKDDYPELVNPIQAEIARLAPELVLITDPSPEVDDQDMSGSEIVSG